MASPLRPQEAHDPWHQLRGVVWVLVAAHVLALLFWIMQLVRTGISKKPSAKQH